MLLSLRWVYQAKPWNYSLENSRIKWILIASAYSNQQNAQEANTKRLTNWYTYSIKKDHKRQAKTHTHWHTHTLTPEPPHGRHNIFIYIYNENAKFVPKAKFYLQKIEYRSRQKAVTSTRRRSYIYWCVWQLIIYKFIIPNSIYIYTYKANIYIYVYSVYTTYIQHIYKDIYILYIIHIQYCACQYLNIYSKWLYLYLSVILFYQTICLCEKFQFFRKTIIRSTNSHYDFYTNKSFLGGRSAQFVAQFYNKRKI